MDSDSVSSWSGFLFLCFFFFRFDGEFVGDDGSDVRGTSSEVVFSVEISFTTVLCSGEVNRGVGSVGASFFFFFLPASKGSIRAFFLMDAPRESSSASESCFDAGSLSSSPRARLLPLPERWDFSRSVSREEVATSGIGAPTPSLQILVQEKIRIRHVVPWRPSHVFFELSF